MSDSEIKQAFVPLVSDFLKYSDKLKDMQTKKKEIETTLKELFESSDKKQLIVHDKKISYSETTRKTAPKFDEIMEIVHSKLMEIPALASSIEEIMADILEEIESRKKESITKTLRVSKS